MKNIFSAFAILCVLASFTDVGDFYDIKLKTIDGKPIHLRDYKGKKILFIILPLNDSSVAMIDELAAFKNKYRSKIEIIGIPAIEEGFKSEDEQRVKKIYKQDRNMNIVIAEGLRVKKASGNNQSELFKWLTDKERNRHFNQDVKGIGHKFFVNEKGKLYAVLNPQASLSARVINRIINQPE